MKEGSSWKPLIQFRHIFVRFYLLLAPNTVKCLQIFKNWKIFVNNMGFQFLVDKKDPKYPAALDSCFWHSAPSDGTYAFQVIGVLTASYCFMT